MMNVSLFVFEETMGILFLRCASAIVSQTSLIRWGGYGLIMDVALPC